MTMRIDCMLASIHHINGTCAPDFSDRPNWPFMPEPVIPQPISKRKYARGKIKRSNDRMDENLNTITHEDLMDLVIANQDKTAFKQIYLYFAPRLKSHLLKLGMQDRGAEELSQEVMMTLWQKADKFDRQKAKLSTWLFRVARNKFIDRTRKQKYPMVNADDHINHMASSDETDKPVETKQLQSHVSKAIETLNEKQKELVLLSFYQELSHAAIADRLKLPLGTVKSRLRSAFAKLRIELGEMR